MEHRRLTAILSAGMLLIAGALMGCDAESDPRDSGAVAGAASAPAVPAAQGGSVSAVAALGATVQVENPAEAYTTIQAEMQSALDDTGLNANAALQHIANARGAYEQIFQAAARELAPEAGTRIESRLADAEEAARVAKRHPILLGASAIEGSLIQISFRSIELSIEEEDADELARWFPVVRAGLAMTETAEASVAASDIAATPTAIGELSATLLRDIHDRAADQIRGRTIEALSAIEVSNTAAASRQAIAAAVLYEAISADVASRLGGEADRQIADSLDDLRESSESGDLAATRVAVQSTADILEDYLAKS